MDAIVEYRILGYTLSLQAQHTKRNSPTWETALSNHTPNGSASLPVELKEAFRSGWIDAQPSPIRMTVTEISNATGFSTRYIIDEIERYNNTDGHTGLRASRKEGRRSYEIEKADFDVWWNTPRRGTRHTRRPPVQLTYLTATE